LASRNATLKIILKNRCFFLGYRGQDGLILVFEVGTVLVQYEKIPNFCFFCECGDGVHPKESCQWGDWLRVPFNSLMPARDDRGGRGRGRGRGQGGRGGRGAANKEELDVMEVYADGEEDADKDGDLNMSATLAIEDSKELAPNANVSPLAEQDKKRPRISDKSVVPATENPNVRSVLSFEESG
jgi:hypothetical protein